MKMHLLGCLAKEEMQKFMRGSVFSCSVLMSLLLFTVLVSFLSLPFRPGSRRGLMISSDDLDFCDGGWERMGASLKLDSNDNPHISYYGSGLSYAKWNGSIWNIETVDWDRGCCSSTVLDSDKHLYISYFNRSSLKYAIWTGSGWNNEVINENITSGGNYDGVFSLLSSFGNYIVDDSAHPRIPQISWNSTVIRLIIGAV